MQWFIIERLLDFFFVLTFNHTKCKTKQNYGNIIDKKL